MPECLDPGSASCCAEPHPTSPNPKRCFLFVECASPQVQVGLWQNGRWIAFQSSNQPALESLYTCLGLCLADARCSFDQVEGFIFDEGPGSLLGLRIAVMAIRTWLALGGPAQRPVYAFRSLPALAAQLASTPGIPPQFTILSDYRKGTWLTYTHPEAQLAVKSSDELLTMPHSWFHLPQRKTWSPPPGKVTPVSLDWRDHSPLLGQSGLLRLVDRAEVFAPHTTQFQTWSNERHRRTDPPAPPT